MSTSKLVKSQRCDDSLSILCKDGKAVFFTLTTRDECDYHEIRARWRRLRNWLFRKLDFPHYVMNYELHPGFLIKEQKIRTGEVVVVHGNGCSHGWHIHGVMSRFLPLNGFLGSIRSFGFGRVDVRRVTSLGVSDYLTKHALKAYRGLSASERSLYPKMRFRLVNCSRGLPRLSDYFFDSDFITRRNSIFREWYSEISNDVKPPFSLIRLWLSRSSSLALIGKAHWWEWPSLYH